MKKSSKIILLIIILVAVIIAIIGIYSYQNRSEEYPFTSCDFNRNGTCDNTDFDLFQMRIGACIGDTNYLPTADANADNCISLEDQKELFPLKSKNFTTVIKFCNNEPWEECEKRCEWVAGKKCESVTSKAQKLEKGVCYQYPAQQMEGDPCSYCVINCR